MAKVIEATEPARAEAPGPAGRPTNGAAGESASAAAAQHMLLAGYPPRGVPGS